MRIRLANKFALLAALGTVVTTLGAAHLPATPTYASPLQSLTANDFNQVALQGFGDPVNSWPWSMAWYKNHLYVGTNRAFLCFTTAAQHHANPAVPYPPLQLSQNVDMAYACNPDPQALPLAAEIWRLDPSAGPPFTQTNWTRVLQSPYGGPYYGQQILVPDTYITTTSVLTPAPRDTGFRGMTVYTDTNGDQALYVSGVNTSVLNGPSVPPPSLLRTTDGSPGTWQAVPSDAGTALGDINQLPGGCCMRGAVGYNGKFYIVIGDITGAGAVYVSPDPRQGTTQQNPGNFQQLTPKGWQIAELQTFNGHLYIGVESTAGYSVVEYNEAACNTLPCPSTAFTTIVPPGGGLGASGNQSVTAMHVFTDPHGVSHLYVGTADGPLTHLQPAEVVRINPDNSWDLVVGKWRFANGTLKFPTSFLPAGFGWPFNEHMWRIADYNGVLYVGTFNSVTNLLKFIPVLNQLTKPYWGFHLWASTDGLTFLPVTTNGFGDGLSVGVRNMEGTPAGLFVGAANQWRGLRIWQGAVPSASLQVAPQNAQVDRAAGGGLAVAWDAPSGANLFHVYRSTAAPVTLPPSDAAAAAQFGLPRTLTIPNAYTEIGTTTGPYYVDRSAHLGTHYTYYVVAEDGQGTLSAPSNVASDPAQAPLPTFQYVTGVVQYLMAHSKITAAQAAKIDGALQAARFLLNVGNAQASRRLLDVLRQQVVARAQGPIGHLYAENLALLLGRLEKRVALVGAHVVSASAVR